MNHFVIQFLLVLFFVIVFAIWKKSAEIANNREAPKSSLKSSIDTHRKVVDEYLSKWDQFAQGNNQLVPYVRNYKEEFENSLAKLLKARDPGSPARLVFYAVVQVGGYIEVDTELGRFATELLGSEFPITKTEEGKRILFCADLYTWWKKNEARLEHFQLFDEWLQRDFAKRTVIPMYENLQKQSK